MLTGQSILPAEPRLRLLGASLLPVRTPLNPERVLCSSLLPRRKLHPVTCSRTAASWQGKGPDHTLVLEGCLTSEGGRSFGALALTELTCVVLSPFIYVQQQPRLLPGVRDEEKEANS